MKLIIDNEIAIKSYIYETEEERDEHIKEMNKIGYDVKKKGVKNISPESTITAFDNEANWHPFAEFYKVKQMADPKGPIYYETELYFSNIYKKD